MDNPLVKKLLIRQNQNILVRNAPAGFLDSLQPLPEGTQLSEEGAGPFDVVLLFVRSKAEVSNHTMEVLKSTREGGVLWMIYPKRSAKILTDINRDAGWDPLWDAGWVGISIVAIDDTWAGLRFRPATLVKRKPDSIFLK